MAHFRKQHLLARLSLEQFVDSNGHVWTYDKERGKTWNRIPEETGVISHFYTFKMPDGSSNTVFERMLGKIESDAAPVYLKLLNNEHINDDEKFAFSHFLGATHARTTSARRINAKIIAHHLLADLVVTADSEAALEVMIHKLNDGNVDDVAKARFREDIADLSDIVIEVPKDWTLNAISTGDKLAHVFSRMGWTVATTTSHYFVTCDNPVHRAVDPKTVHPFYGDLGFLNRTALVTFALSPRKLLILTHAKEFASAIDLPRDYVLNENSKRAFDAEGYVYAHVLDDDLARLVANYRGERPNIETSGFEGVRGFGEAKVSR